MPVIKGKLNDSKYNDVISYNMRDYRNEPFFIRKSQEAVEFLEKHPIPKWILRDMRR